MIARSSRGFSLIEMIVAITLLSVILGSLFGVVTSVQRDYVRQRQANRAQEAIRASEMAIATALQAAKADPLKTGNAVIYPNPLNNATWNNVRVLSDYNPADGDFADPLEDVQFWLAGDSLKVRWQAGQTGAVLAHPVSLLRFRYYYSSGAEITDAGSVGNAKRVKLRIEAPRTGSWGTDVLETWIYLRN